MTRLTPPALEDLTAEARETLEAIGDPLGQIPNLYRLLALDSDLLDIVSLLEAKLKRHIDLPTWERIALAVSEVNQCDYCLSSHSFIARVAAKLDEDEIERARRGSARDVRDAEILRFARAVAELGGRIPDADLARMRKLGFQDVQIIRLVLAVAFSTITNFVNNVALTDIDFPAVHAIGRAS